MLSQLAMVGTVCNGVQCVMVSLANVIERMRNESRGDRTD